MITFSNRHSAIICYYSLLSESLYMSMKASKTKTSISISQDFSFNDTHKNRYMTFVEKHSSPVYLKELFFKDSSKVPSQIYTIFNSCTFILQLTT